MEALPFARDLDLIRDILIWMENGAPSDSRPSPDNDQRFAYHCQLMKEAEMIEAAIMIRPGATTMGEPRRAVVTALLWKGQEALEAMRNDTVWIKTKSLLKDKALPAMFDVVFAVAKTYAQQLAASG